MSNAFERTVDIVIVLSVAALLAQVQFGAEGDVVTVDTIELSTPVFDTLFGLELALRALVSDRYVIAM